VIGSPWKRPKRDRDIIRIAGVHPHAGISEAGILPLPRIPIIKAQPANKETE
jgi:hypothetical protein